MNPYHEGPYIAEPEEPRWDSHDRLRCACRALDAVYAVAMLTGRTNDAEAILRARNETERSMGDIVDLGQVSTANVRIYERAYDATKDGMIQAREGGYGY